jgi:hypothetical protein
MNKFDCERVGKIVVSGFLFKKSCCAGMKTRFFKQKSRKQVSSSLLRHGRAPFAATQNRALSSDGPVGC